MRDAQVPRQNIWCFPMAPLSFFKGSDLSLQLDDMTPTPGNRELRAGDRSCLLDLLPLHATCTDRHQVVAIFHTKSTRVTRGVLLWARFPTFPTKASIYPPTQLPTVFTSSTCALLARSVVPEVSTGPDTAILVRAYCGKALLPASFAWANLACFADSVQDSATQCMQVLLCKNQRFRR